MLMFDCELPQLAKAKCHITENSLNGLICEFLFVMICFREKKSMVGRPFSELIEQFFAI